MIRYRDARLEMARQQRAAQIAALAVESGRRLESGSPGAGRRAAIGILLLAVYAGVLTAAGASATVLPLLAVLVCATLSSIAGFAFSALGQALLAGLMSSPVHIVQTLMVCSIATQTFSIASLWHHMEWRRLPAFLIGGALGLPVGVYVLLHLAPRGFHVVVGALLVAYGAYVVVKRPIVLPRTGRLADAGIGFLGGITGGVAAFPGAAITIWCGMKGWDKARQRGVYQPFILVMQIAALTLITLLHMRGAHASAGAPLELFTTVVVVPGALLGTWFGLCIFHRISDRGFEVCVATLLMFSGMAMLV